MPWIETDPVQREIQRQKAFGRRKSGPFPDNPNDPEEQALDELAKQDFVKSLKEEPFSYRMPGEDIRYSDTKPTPEAPKPGWQGVDQAPPVSSSGTPVPIGDSSTKMGYLKDLFTPRTTLQDVLDPNYWNQIAVGATGGAALGMLGGNPIAGGVVGALSTPLLIEGQKREREKFLAMGYSPEEADRRAAVSSTVLGLGSGLFGSPRVTPSMRSLPPQGVPDIPPEIRSFTPEGHPSLQPPGPQQIPLGRSIEVPVTQPQPSILELAKQLQPEVSVRSVPEGVKYSRLLGTETLPTVGGAETGPITPGFLKTAEQKVGGLNTPQGIFTPAEERIPFRTKEGPPSTIREAKYFKPGVPEGTGPYVDPLTKALQETIHEDPNFRLYPQEAELLKHLPSEGYSGSLMVQPKQAEMQDFQFLGPEPTTLPNPARRMRMATNQVLRKMGQDEGHLATIEEYVNDSAEMGTRQNFLDWENLFKKVYPDRKIKTPLTGIVRHELGMEQYFSKEEHEALLALSEYGGDVSKMPPKIKNNLPVEDPVLRKFWEQSWQIMTGRVSARPGSQATLRYNPLSGEMEPAGPPTPFNPHIPVDPKTAIKLTDSYLRKLYRRYDPGSEYDFQTWKTKFLDILNNPDSHNPPVDPTFRKFANLERKRFIDVGEIAKEKNMYIGDVLKELGYEHDYMRMNLRFNLGGQKRAGWVENKDVIDRIYTNLIQKYGFNSPQMDWINAAMERSQGIAVREDFLRNNDAMGKFSALFYGAALKTAGATNILLQQAVHGTQVGYLNMMKGLGTYMLNKMGYGPAEKIADVVDRAAVNFPTFLARYTQAQNNFQRYSRVATELNMFSPSDALTRNLAGFSTYPYAERVITQFYKNPMGRGLEAAVRELKLNPNDVLSQMRMQPPEMWRTPWYGGEAVPQVPPQLMEKAIQGVVNRTMGRTGANSMPLWAMGDSNTKKMFVALQRQILSNSAAFHDIVVNAPTIEKGIERGLRWVFGGAAGGAMYTIVKNLYQGKEMFEPNQSLEQAFKKMGVEDKDMRRMTAFWTQSLLNGVGTLGSTFLLSGLDFYGNPTFVQPPLLAPAPITYTEDIIRQLAQGNWGKAAYSMQPLPLPPAAWKEEKKPKGGMGMGMGMGMGGQ